MTNTQFSTPNHHFLRSSQQNQPVTKQPRTITGQNSITAHRCFRSIGKFIRNARSRSLAVIVRTDPRKARPRAPPTLKRPRNTEEHKRWGFILATVQDSSQCAEMILLILALPAASAAEDLFLVSFWIVLWKSWRCWACCDRWCNSKGRLSFFLFFVCNYSIKRCH